MTVDTDAERPDGSDSGSPASRSQSDVPRIGILRAIFKFRWLILYVVTVATIIWWYEFRPARLALREIQGNWQTVEGVFPDERLGDSYRHVNANDTWLIYPLMDKWEVQRSRITVRPADNFFVVRRAFGFDYGNTRETEYILHIKNDEMYILRGLARLDSVRENTVEKLRSVDSLPDGARDSIQEYLHRISIVSSNNQCTSGRD